MWGRRMSPTWKRCFKLWVSWVESLVEVVWRVAGDKTGWWEWQSTAMACEDQIEFQAQEISIIRKITIELKIQTSTSQRVPSFYRPPQSVVFVLTFNPFLSLPLSKTLVTLPNALNADSWICPTLSDPTLIAIVMVKDWKRLHSDHYKPASKLWILMEKERVDAFPYLHLLHSWAKPVANLTLVLVHQIWAVTRTREFGHLLRQSLKWRDAIVKNLKIFKNVKS